jgi:hypothetical protein
MISIVVSLKEEAMIDFRNPYIGNMIPIAISANNSKKEIPATLRSSLR